MNKTVVTLGLLLAMNARAAPTTDSSTKANSDTKANAAAAMARLMTPGPQHKLLEQLIGTWSATMTMWMNPKKPPVVATTTAVSHAVGKLWVVEDVNGEFMGQPFAGSATYGYDIAKQKYVSTWIDNGGSSIVSAEGLGDPSGKVITFTSQETDPTTGKPSTLRQVIRFDSDSKRTNTMYKIGADGKETKVVEVVYTRK